MQLHVALLPDQDGQKKKTRKPTTPTDPLVITLKNVAFTSSLHQPYSDTYSFRNCTTF